MTTADKIALVAAIAASLQTLLLVVSLPFLYRQTAAANRSAREAVRGLRVLALNETANALSDLNVLLIEHEELLPAANASKQDALHHIMLTRFEQIFALAREGLIEGTDLDGWREWIRECMQRDDLVQAWQEVRHAFGKDFGRWLDEVSKGKV